MVAERRRRSADQVGGSTRRHTHDASTKTVVMISAGRGRRGTASVLLGAVVLIVVLGWSTSMAGAQAEIPSAPGDGTPPTTVSPLQPGVPPDARLEPESESVGVGAPAPLRISTGDDGGRRRPPLWVGAVVGASGVLGLALSAALHRRRAATGGPDERDLAKAV
jgi:hypothetical protein